MAARVGHVREEGNPTYKKRDNCADGVVVKVKGSRPPSFEQFFNNEEFSDVKIIVGSKEFFAHKNILSSSSEVFKTMLSSAWCNSSETKLEETYQSEEVFSDFLRFLYTWEVSLSEENIIPLLMLADKYMVNDLTTVCIDFMISNISTDNAIPWFKFALQYEVETLFSKCITYISHNYEYFLETDKLNELEAKELSLILDSGAIVCSSEMKIVAAILKWMKAYDRPVNDEVVEEVVKLFSLVRYPLLSPQDVDKLERMPELRDVLPKLIPRFYLCYKFHCLGVCRVTPEEKGVKNMVPRIYTEVCGATVKPSFVDVFTFETPVHLSAQVKEKLRWKYERQHCTYLKLVSSGVSPRNPMVRIVQMTKQVRSSTGVQEVIIMNDNTVQLHAASTQSVYMGTREKNEANILHNGMTICVLPVMV